MHGRPRDVTWTRLSSSALAGSTVITVETSTGWLPGDQIVIAPSGWEVTEGEIRTIVSISGQGIASLLNCIGVKFYNSCVLG